MNAPRMSSVSAIAALGLASAVLLMASAHMAFAASAKQLVGTWRLVSTTNTDAKGIKIEPFGPHPLGSVTFDADGHFTQVIVNSEPPTKRNKNQQHVVANFGEYSVTNGGNTLAIHIVGSNAQSVDGTEADRGVTLLANGDMKISNSSGSVRHTGTRHVEAIWRRVK